QGDGNPMGRNFRDSDLWFDSLDEAIAATRDYLAQLERMRDGGGLLLDEDGTPLALDVTPEAFPGAHFATFGTRLIKPLVQAGTSERGCCAACGAPWARVVEVAGETVRERAKRLGFSDYAKAYGSNPQGLNHAGGHDSNEQRHRHTLGWRPTCTCDAATVPAVVLDPFGGSGTTSLVARQLGRHSIYVDLSEEYAQLALKRLQGQALALLWEA